MTVGLRSLPRAFFFKLLLLFLIENEEKKWLADFLIELENRGFGMSTVAFLKSVKKFQEGK